uniref:Uncharacterized protein n=1 Tax=Arundo donax TaxID=35708 RepID=A0A0A8ZTS3_ARUDO
MFTGAEKNGQQSVHTSVEVYMMLVSCLSVILLFLLCHELLSYGSRYELVE